MTNKQILNLLFFILIASKIEGQHIISFERIDSLIIKNSSFKDVQKFFPNGEIVRDTSGGDCLVHVLMADGTSRYINGHEEIKIATYYTLKDEGISFYFNFVDTLSTITIWGENFKTDKGIIPGKSTFHDLDKTYGVKEVGYTMSLHAYKYVWVKSYKNLYFLAKNKSIWKRKDKIIIDHIYILTKGAF